jgi:hypothetical protein
MPTNINTNIWFLWKLFIFCKFKKYCLVIPKNYQKTHIQWGEQVFESLAILQVFLLTKHVEVGHFYHRYTSTVRDGI